MPFCGSKRPSDAAALSSCSRFTDLGLGCWLIANIPSSCQSTNVMKRAPGKPRLFARLRFGIPLVVWQSEAWSPVIGLIFQPHENTPSNSGPTHSLKSWDYQADGETTCPPSFPRQVGTGTINPPGMATGRTRFGANARNRSALSRIGMIVEE